MRFRLRQRKPVENINPAPSTNFIAVNTVGTLVPRCPCNCSCHRIAEAPPLCNEEMTGTEFVDQKIGPDGKNVCWWCYTVCEGPE